MLLIEILENATDNSTEIEKAKLEALYKRYGYEEADIQKYLSQLFADYPAIKVID